MRILITGGSGFIGKNLVEYLSKKHEVIAPSHSYLELSDEVSVGKFFEKNDIDIVIHSASVGGKRKASPNRNILKENLKMFFNLVNNSKYYKKMIFFGSGAEYGKSRPLKNVKESDFGKYLPGDDYGLYKYICSKVIEKSDNIVNLRLFGVFGKYEDYDTRFISNIICRVIFDLPVEINQNMFLDYVYVEDLCRIVDYFIENKANHKFYNIGPEKHLDLLSIAEKIKKISGRKFEMNVKKKELNKEYSCDNSRLMEELGDFKFTDIDESIKQLYDWYEENKDKIKKEGLTLY
jgi:GDP-L-fucose synthase